LIQRGFIVDYKVWIHHGEAQLTGNTCVNNVNDEVHDADEDDDEDLGDHGMMHEGDLENDNGDPVGVNDDLRAQEEEEHDIDTEEILHHIEPKVLLGSAKGLEHFETLKKAAKDCMYDGCGKEWTVLRFVLQLLILKAKFCWSDNSFNDLLILLGQLLPKPNFVPKNTYEAKKLINPLKICVQRIHACPNRCILYRGDYAALTKCPNCEASRYKSNASFSEDGVGSTVRKRKRASKKSAVCEVEDDTCIGTETGQRKIPSLVMWYLPVIDRLKRLFSNPNTAKLMMWHDDRPLKNDGKLRHPSDTRQWKTFDANHELFGEEKRNVRFALSTDGMNPFGERSSTHSTWPVLLTIFNLPP